MKTVVEIREAFLNFFNTKGHYIDEEVSMLSKDPSTLFVVAGMQPQKEFLMGKENPKGTRLVSAQRCLRTNDIDGIGDERHLTNFIMMGHFSFRDYYKEDSIKWTLEFFCNKLELDINKMYVTCFEGNLDAPKDIETAKIWQTLGIPEERIYFLGKRDNWWELEGQEGPAGPDTELFYDTGAQNCSEKCAPGCACNKYVEICNNVFMQYQRTAEGKYIIQKNPSVDSGFGLERIACVVNNLKSVYQTEIYEPIMQLINIKINGGKSEANERIICDHLRSSIFLINDGVIPSNVGAGYILRRLIRRIVRKLNELNLNPNDLEYFANEMIDNFIRIGFYPELLKQKQQIIVELNKEKEKFGKTLQRGERELNYFIQEMIDNKSTKMDPQKAFKLYDTYGFPIELTQESLKTRGFDVDIEAFKQCLHKHQQISKGASLDKNQAKGGLVEQNYTTIKLHTATHLLNAALKNIVGEEIRQKGSNITTERLRFDFSCDRTLSKDEIEKVENLVNKHISNGLVVEKLETTPEGARMMGAEGVFDDKYGEKILVYKIGDVSLEICGGPHVNNTSELGSFIILGMENIGSGIKRIKAHVK